MNNPLCLNKKFAAVISLTSLSIAISSEKSALSAESKPIKVTATTNQTTTSKVLGQACVHVIKQGTTAIPFSDPFVERRHDGHILITGTAKEILEYPSETDLFSDNEPIRHSLDFFHPSGAKFNDDENPWDLMLINCGGDHNEAVYLGGSMTPQVGRSHAQWPADNFSRRTYVFRTERNVKASPARTLSSVSASDMMSTGVGSTKKESLNTASVGRGLMLTRDEKPLMPDLGVYDWIGHNYGRDLVRTASGEPVQNLDGSLNLIYERVTRVLAGGQLVTEIATRKLRCSDLSTGPENILLAVNDVHPYPSAERSDGGLLIEGPRVMRVDEGANHIYLMGFSSGDFPTDHYGLNFAYSNDPDGPYKPILNGAGTDLKDFGTELKIEYGFSWGPGRPAFYQSQDQKLWLFFHAIEKSNYPGVDFTKWPANLEKFERHVYFAPIEVKLAKDASTSIKSYFKPQIKIGSQSCEQSSH